MRRILASEMVTVDGFFSGSNGELDWFVQDEEVDKFANDLLDSVDAILYGRTTYQMMAGYWPHASGSFAEKTNRLPKLVFTSTLEETPWGEWDNAKSGQGTARRRNREAESRARRRPRDLRQREHRAGAFAARSDRRVSARRESGVARSR